jgi:hypothetical protein
LTPNRHGLVDTEQAERLKDYASRCLKKTRAELVLRLVRGERGRETPEFKICKWRGADEGAGQSAARSLVAGSEMQTKHSLVRVAGTVADLKTSSTSENFVFGSGDSAAGGAAAVGLAAAGLAGAATGAAMSSGDAADKVTAFECKVGTQSVTGRFGEVTFADGDQIEVVGRVFDGALGALAVVRPSDRTIWMHPHCSRGSEAYRRFCLRWIPTLSLLTPAVFVLTMTLISGSEGLDFWFFATMVVSGAVAVAILLLLLARRFRRFARLSDQIFVGLQFDQPESVDLPKRLSAASGELSPEDRQRYHPWKRWVYKY